MSALADKRIKVLCVDDSALIRKLVSEIVDAEPDMTMVATAPDPLVARELIKRHNPDVLTLDVEMPRMDGLDFLGKLMRLRPMPVVMLSSLTARGSDVTLQALELGAVDFVTKPQLGLRDGLVESSREIVDKIRAAAQARLRGPSTSVAPESAPSLPRVSSEKLFIVGASTGGTEAIRTLLEPMPANAPAILVTQHMPAGFTASFARRLDSLCRIHVKEAEHGERVLPGHAYIAPGGDFHLRLERSGANYMVALDPAPPVNRHRPSVDVLFDSAARHAGRNATGILLTGMGKDGALGLLHMREAGAATLAQDEASCVVFGMPREAIAIGAAQAVVPLESMCREALNLLNESAQPALRI
ncbi:chemotaxis-specific protein-glutamate methyltransferase [Salinisphaera dokdonensis CL-ES53]|uniref:Protein-glutamate methylesterase/protein-glutamine glutaminase n=1 Tax=Salinisphaera dokdonensis CL-ES53 TaxID=1304272 RepID=A0ABV2AZD2_9GAMM